MKNNSKISILLIEDNTLDYFLFCEYLNDTNLNINICYANNFNEATHFLNDKKNSFSIIFSDLNLPDANGTFIIDSLTKITLKKTPTVYLTGLASLAVNKKVNNNKNHNILLKENLNSDILKTILNNL